MIVFLIEFTFCIRLALLDWVTDNLGAGDVSYFIWLFLSVVAASMKSSTDLVAVQG